jgi:hypothetical protein
MIWRLPDTYHSAGHGRGTATLKFYEGRDILPQEPAPGVRLIRGLDRTKKETTSRAVPQPFFTPVRRRASRTKD